MIYDIQIWEIGENFKVVERNQDIPKLYNHR